MGAPEAATIAFVVRGPIHRSDLPGLYDRVCRVLGESGAPCAVCDVTGIEADAVAADALARLALAGRRRGCRVLLRGSSEQLRELLAFMGLGQALPEAEGPPPVASPTCRAAPEARTSGADAGAAGRT